jgi:hypothetical protein
MHKGQSDRTQAFLQENLRPEFGYSGLTLSAKMARGRYDLRSRTVNRAPSRGGVSRDARRIDENPYLRR